MEKAEFIKLVKEMRNMQKNYFQKRDKFYLHEALKLERLVDTAIKDMLVN